MRINVDAAGVATIQCPRCGKIKEASKKNFYRSTAFRRGQVAEFEWTRENTREGGSYGETKAWTATCRSCEHDRQAARRVSAASKITKSERTYPLTVHCPNGHGTVTYHSELEEQLGGGKCFTCDATLVREVALRTRSKFEGLPSLPETRHALLENVVSALQAGRHVYLAGPPGTGKSELARQAAGALGLPFYMTACDSSMTRGVMMGLIDAGGAYHRTPLREAVEMGGVYLIDEIDNGNPSLLASLNSAMANGSVAFPDGMVDVHEDFRVIATANTWGTGPTAEFVGRLRVDPATLDRFVRLSVGIDLALEAALAVEHANGDADVAGAVVETVRRIREKLEVEGLKISLGPRAVMQVAALVSRGWSMKDALMTTAIGTLDPRKARELIA